MEKRRGWRLLTRLNKAVRKINVVLSLNMRRWELSWVIRSRKRQQQQQRRLLSFNERVGLQGYVELEDDRSSCYINRGGVLDRTCSLTDEDVDRRAENFIANFRRDLLLERQVSLNLGYCSRVSSFG